MLSTFFGRVLPRFTNFLVEQWYLWHFWTFWHLLTLCDTFFDAFWHFLPLSTSVFLSHVGAEVPPRLEHLLFGEIFGIFWSTVVRRRLGIRWRSLEDLLETAEEKERPRSPPDLSERQFASLSELSAVLESTRTTTEPWVISLDLTLSLSHSLSLSRWLSLFLTPHSLALSLSLSRWLSLFLTPSTLSLSRWLSLFLTPSSLTLAIHEISSCVIFSLSIRHSLTLVLSNSLSLSLSHSRTL